MLSEGYHFSPYIWRKRLKEQPNQEMGGVKKMDFFIRISITEGSQLDRILFLTLREIEEIFFCILSHAVQE